MAKAPRRDNSKGPAVAFLPWVRTAKIRKVGGLRLIPYETGVLPGDLPGVRQRDLDGILRVYADRPRKRVERATILELGSWRSGEDAFRILPKLFRARDFLCFCALSARWLFQGHAGYCNSHNYELIVQRFQPGSVSSVAFRTRRRDGGSNILWGANEFAFHRPLHVAADQRIEFDESLLRALMRLPKSHAWVHEAIVEFNAANTDSADVPMHVEVVMMKSAFEWLLHIDHDAKKFIKAIVGHLAPKAPGTHPSGPLTASWLAKAPKAGVIEAWAREFCIVRNMSAHGGRRGPRQVWSQEAHLAFASVMFPLLAKKVLADERRYRLTEGDRLDLSVLDRLLVHDPMRARKGGLDRHPWTEIRQDVRLHTALEQTYDWVLSRSQAVQI